MTAMKGKITRTYLNEWSLSVRACADESYEQIEKGQVPSAHNGSRQEVDREEIDKLE